MEILEKIDKQLKEEVLKEAKKANIEIKNIFAGNNPKDILDFIKSDLERVVTDNLNQNKEDFEDDFRGETPSEYKLKIELIKIK